MAIWHDLFPGGALRVVSAQASALRALGHDVCIWSPVSSGHDAPDEWFEEHIERRHVRIPQGIRRARIARKFRGEAGAYLDRVAANGAGADLCFAQMRAWKADVLFAHPCWWSFVPPFFAPPGIASVVYLQEPNRSLFEASLANPWALPAQLPATNPFSRVRDRLGDYRRTLSMRLAVRMETEWLRSHGKVLVNSRYSRESVLRAYGCDSVVCPLGVSASPLPDHLQPTKRAVVVSLGDLSPHKAPDLAIRTIGAIPQARRPPLRWYGHRATPGYRQSLEQLAATLGVDFTFTEAASDAVVAHALAEACCFLYCAHLEPFGLSPLEANLAGTCVVAVGEGGVRETITEGLNGFLVSQRNVGALASRVEWLASNLDAAADFGRKARTYTREHFSWTAAGRALDHALFGDADGEAWTPPATSHVPHSRPPGAGPH